MRVLHMMASMGTSIDDTSSNFDDNAFTLVKEDFEKMKVVLRCGICWSTLKDPVVTTCLHAFCRICFNLCMDKLSTLRCPICNQRLNKRSCGTCPQLLELISGYIKLAKLFKCDSAAIDIPKESEFFESQVLMTQNVVENINPLPLQQPTNIATDLKQPLRRHALKRTLGMENSVSSCRPGKVARSAVNVVESRESEVHIRAAAPLHCIKNHIGVTLSTKSFTPPKSAVVSSREDRSLTASNESGGCQGRDDYHTEIKKCLKSYDMVQLNGNPQVLECNAEGGSPFKEDNPIEWSKNQSVKTSSDSVECVSTHSVPHGLTDFQKDIERRKKFSTTEAKAECMKVSSCRCEVSAEARVDTADAAAQCAPMSHTTAVQTHDSGNGRRNNDAQTYVVLPKGQDISIQVMIASHDVVTQTESEKKLMQASTQTLLECQEIGLQTEQLVELLVDSVVQTEVTDDFQQTDIRMDSRKYPEKKTTEEMENGDTFVERRRSSVSHARSDAADAARKLELIVNRRFEKQATETRVQALLACLPWIPTFLGLDYDDFSQRFNDDASPPDNCLVIEHLGEERCSVVEASEDEANEDETNDETALPQNVHSECFNNTLRKETDLNDSRGLEENVEQSRRKQNEEPAPLKCEEKPILQVTYQEKQTRGSQSVNTLEMKTILASKEVVADSLVHAHGVISD
uniref:RING-type domain-containing protein n=1 Tax=Parascaris univalens TaxID=6257 RepID=A0A914ZVR5_PARUN